MGDYHTINAGAVEEDGDEIFTPIPKLCVIWSCNGFVHKRENFWKCDRCGTSYGRVRKSATPEPAP